MWFLKGKFYPKLCHFWSEGGSNRLLEEPARSQFDVFSTLVLQDKEHMVFHRITQCYLNTKGLKYTWGLAVLVFDKTKGKPLLSLVKDKTKCPSGFFFFFSIYIAGLWKPEALLKLWGEWQQRDRCSSSVLEESSALKDAGGQLVKRRMCQGHSNTLRCRLR